MTKLSVVIITFDEEKNIARCIESVKDFADEILVVDSFSTDRTEAICEKYGVRFVKHPFEGYIEQKNHALSLSTHDFVLSLDADEVVSEELKTSILRVVENQTHYGYCFNRLTNYCGQWIRHCGWYPDRKLRLFDKTKGQWAGANPHDKFVLHSGNNPGYLKGDLFHHSYSSISDHERKISHYSNISAREMLAENKNASTFTIISHSLWRFLSDYLLRLGFLDGYFGVVISVMNSYETFLKYAKLKELNNTRGTG